MMLPAAYNPTRPHARSWDSSSSSSSRFLCACCCWCWRACSAVARSLCRPFFGGARSPAHHWKYDGDDDGYYNNGKRCNCCGGGGGGASSRNYGCCGCGNAARCTRGRICAILMAATVLFALVLLVVKWVEVGNRELQIEKLLFLEQASGNYGYNGTIDSLRRSDFPYLEGNVYLDYTGSGLYQYHQVSAFTDNLFANLYGNAHSPSPCSKKTEQQIDAVREIILNFFNAPIDQYTVIFTSGCTGALKLIGESFPFTSKSQYVYLIQNHNSVLGIREFAQAKGASFEALSESDVPNFFQQASERCSAPMGSYSLFAFPAEDNFEGVKYPLEWCEVVHNASTCERTWLVLLDAAAFVPTSPLDISKYLPDFVTVSFYKIFGFPTGLGALILRKEVARKLHSVYWGGGQVVASLSTQHWHQLSPELHEQFEAGTVSFLDIMSVKYGLEFLAKAGGMESIYKHTCSLEKYLYQHLSSLQHANGQKVVEVYGKHDLGDCSKQGPIVTFNVFHPDGTYVTFSEFQTLAASANIHVRTGCTCNPGACHAALGLAPEDVKRVAEQYVETVEGGYEACPVTTEIGGKPFGAIRASIGYPSTFEDIFSFLVFMQDNFVKLEGN
ncbi:molybdenum cofactor sulfurase [Pelomyxa schiedti]|nr:molybdenum cofactor sulfurase [Pelomyxa schiedti]